MNSVCTLYELTKGDETKGTDFHGLENEVILKALKYLEENKKSFQVRIPAEVINSIF